MSMTDVSAVPTPELDKRKEIIDSGATDTLTDFIDWLESKHYVIAEYVEIDGFRDDMLQPIYTRPEQLLAEFFGIDLNKIDAEQRAILEAIRR